jgi:hypothetical protein
MQDRHRQLGKIQLRRTAGPYIWVERGQSIETPPMTIYGPSRPSGLRRPKLGDPGGIVSRVCSASRRGEPRRSMRPLAAQH